MASAGELRYLHRPPTLEDVARAAGVSRALVSLVMRDKPNVSDAKRALVLDAAARLGYRPNAMARSLASRHSRTIGVILDDLSNPFFAEIADGITEEASAQGYHVLLAAGGRMRQRERAGLTTLLEYRVDGMILVSSRMRLSDIRAAAREVPLVMIGRQARDIEADAVVIDEARGVELVLQHLLGLGHRQIAHADGGAAPGGPQRRAAFLRGMREQRLLGAATVIPGEFTESAGIQAGRFLLTQATLPTAVFAANDLVAVGLLRAFDEAGLRVPEDVSLVGYDNISVAELPRISLTTVHQPRPAMGRMAFQMLLDRMQKRPDSTFRLVAPTLVVRSTTAPARDFELTPKPHGQLAR